MKKFLAVILSLSMILSVAGVFALAADEKPVSFITDETPIELLEYKSEDFGYGANDALLNDGIVDAGGNMSAGDHRFCGLYKESAPVNNGKRATAYVMADLGAPMLLTEVKVHFLDAQGGWGVQTPDKIKITVSQDSKQYDPVEGEFTIPTGEQYSTAWANQTFEIVDPKEKGAVIGRYIRFEISADIEGKDYIAFIDEIDVIGHELKADVVEKFDPHNIARGKSYTLRGVFPTLDTAAWPDEGNVTLTDGVYSGVDELTFQNHVWIGFNTGSSEIVNGKSEIELDLGEKYDIDAVNIEYFSGEAGIKWPLSIEVYIDNNKVGEMTYDKFENVGKDLAVLELAEPVNGQVVKLVVTHASNWAFFSELEIISNNTTVTLPDDNSSEAPAPDTSDEPAAPDTGDFGINALIVVAIAAIGVAALVIKKRA